MVLLDGTIVNIALPRMQTDLGFSDAGRQWVATAFGIFSSIAMAGSATGLLLGGALTEYVDWRWCLYVNIVFAAVAFAGALTFIPKDGPRGSHRIDLPGTVLGYDAVDIGTLADSWRSEPGTPVYVQPYLAKRPATAMSQDEAYRWFLNAPGITVPTDRVKELTATATRVAAGDARATLA